MKNIVILGAGRPQLPAIARAHRLGYRVINPDRNPQAPGLAHVEFPLPGVSTHDAGAVLEELERLRRQGVVADGVLTVAVEASHSAARVAAGLGLPGVGVAVADRCSDKLERLRVLRDAGVSCPRFRRAERRDEALDQALELGFPVVLKPVRGAGAQGVVRCDDAAAVARYWETAEREPGASVLIEEFLEGTEHSSESLVLEGRIYTTGFSDRNYDTKDKYPPHCLENGDTLPSSLAPQVVQRALREVEGAIRALGIDFGPAKGDLLITPEGRPYVLEMATRLSGDYFCSHTVPLHNDTDIISAAMQQAVGDPVDRSLLVPAERTRGVALRYFWPEPLPGVIREIRGWEECASLAGVALLTWEPYWAERQVGLGACLTPPTSHRERVGCVLAHGADREEAVALANHVVERVRIEMDPLVSEVQPCHVSSL